MMIEESTTKNDLGVDYIDRQATLDAIIKRLGIKNETYLLEAERAIYQQILAMPSVTPQEPITWIVGKNNAQIAVKNMPIDKLQKICAIIGDEQEPTTKIEESNFSQEQYKADLQSAYDCGFEAGKKAEQEPRWIPVSEKLPNDRDWYLGIFKESDTGWINPLPFICDYVGSETKATTKEYWILRGFTDRDYKDCDYYYNLECVAWMPLPQNYGEVEE